MCEEGIFFLSTLFLSPQLVTATITYMNKSMHVQTLVLVSLFLVLQKLSQRYCSIPCFFSHLTATFTGHFILLHKSFFNHFIFIEWIYYNSLLVAKGLLLIQIILQ